jgi:hypothetical protein
LSNLKNSLKSGGSGIVAIEHLLFDGQKSLMRTLAAPIPLPFLVLLLQRNDGEGSTIYLTFHTRSL